MKEKTPEKLKVKFSNTPMDEKMFTWVTNAAWKRKMDRAAYIRSLIQREMDIEKTWDDYQSEKVINDRR